jgi:hypothetical protein
LIIAGFLAERRIRPLLQEFLERKLIAGDSMTRFEAAVASAYRLRNSLAAEVLLIAFVYVVGILVVWRQYVALDTAAWYTTPTAEGSRLSLAGMWYGYVSLPIFQFILCRWYFRLLIWARFLWQVSRIKLSLVPTHPDYSAGLSFVSETVRALMVFAAAHGAVLAGYIATRIFSVGATLPQFKVEIAAMVVFVLCITLGPLLVFTPQLSRTKRRGRREYGTFAQSYVRQFDGKWLRRGPAEEGFLGNPDIQSLADLNNSYAVVRTMGVFLITKEVALRIALATLVPVAPLLLTMMPIDDILKHLVSILLK